MHLVSTLSHEFNLTSELPPFLSVMYSAQMLDFSHTHWTLCIWSPNSNEYLCEFEFRHWLQLQCTVQIIHLPVFRRNGGIIMKFWNLKIFWYFRDILHVISSARKSLICIRVVHDGIICVYNVNIMPLKWQ